MKDKDNVIRLEISAVSLDDVVIRTDDPLDLLNMAFRELTKIIKVILKCSSDFTGKP